MKTKLAGHHPHISPNYGEPEYSEIEVCRYWIEYCKPNDDYVVMLEIAEYAAECPYGAIFADYGFNMLDYWKV